MARTLTVIDINGEDVTHLNASIDILDEPVCMNLGVAFMPFMDEEFLFLKEDASPDSTFGVNKVETELVKFLYQIRKKNRLKDSIEYDPYTNPYALVTRSRIFIGGKIFSSIDVRYSKEYSDYTKKNKANCSNIKKDTLSKAELEKFNNKNISSTYISIDNGKIKIFLPKETLIGVNYFETLYDFLTNGSRTAEAVKYGEFPDLDFYELATGNTKLQNGCWLTKDRKSKNDTWKNACMYIVEHKLQGVIAPFSQIADFYGLLKEKVAQSKHKTRWLKGAYKLVDALNIVDGGSAFVSNDVEIILNELNIGICDYAITQFYDLFYGKYKNSPLDTFDKAYKWDLSFVQHEQGSVALPIYAKVSKNTIEKFQNMADKDGQSGWHGATGIFNRVTPEFDDPWNGKVTDPQFRIDLPMLMLWLDKHKPTIKDKNSPFYGKVDKNGYLLEKYKKIIRKYEAK
ncbi:MULTISPECIES: hypothetical protein [Empedobacter]|uniref:Uncharacterized protein n=1 Tax=Empedobacter falsenii TaxID=343874 RepID=A0A7H9DTE5_9FLAO|nr:MULTISPECIES: hypothetical protein [Empedobacter]MDH2208327.1 hypothetical protein [Empedobacter sp. GD03644]QLL58006.1 hypothetical protein FH779_07905 [Empedobacter falsenii]